MKCKYWQLLAISDAYASNNILLTSAERAVGPALGFPLEEIKRGVRALELGAAGEERERFEAEALALIENYFNGYRFPGVGDDGLYCPQLCLKVLHALCDEKNQVYLDEKGDRFWRKVAPEEIMQQAGRPSLRTIRRCFAPARVATRGHQGAAPPLQGLCGVSLVRPRIARQVQ